MQEILQRIQSTENLPSLPAIALQVLQLSRRTDTSVEELAAVIERDPALAAKLLKVVNSPLFGVPREVSSLKQAVSLLGLRRVRIMALSFSVVDSIAGVQGADFDLASHWRRSLSTAVAARLIAGCVSPELIEEAFVAGLLSDIGIVLAWRCAPDLYAPVLQAVRHESRPIEQIEADQLGCTHAAMGRRLLSLWSLPEILCDAVSAHHGEGLAALRGPSHRLATIMTCAARIAELFSRGISADQLERVEAECLDRTGIERSALHGVLDVLDRHVQETAGILAVPVGTALNFAQLQAEATMQMVQLSIEAETERADAHRLANHACLEAHRLNAEKAAILEAASTDSLTNLANRAAFDRRLQEELQRARDLGHSLGLIFLDVDHFKQFNDAHGHQAGDCVLRSVGSCLRDVVRSVGFPARYGGEEFVVIVANRAADEIRAMAEEIRNAIQASSVDHAGEKLQVTASFGAACFSPPWGVTTPEQLIRQADDRLYEAKRTGRNRVVAPQ